MSKTMIYLASPLGFSPENRSYLNKVKNRLNSLGYEVFDPWVQQAGTLIITQAQQTDSYSDRVALFRNAASRIGMCNAEGIRQSEILLAILDGIEVDSGTAAELGFASALGKRCYGLRTDFRDSGDFPGIAVNLQLLYFIECSGGRLFRDIDAISLEVNK